MTDAEKDAAWRSLPAKIKEQFANDYSIALQAHSLDPNNPRIDAHIKFLEELFGKHNLTATTKESQDKTMNKKELLKLRKERGKQTLNIGDKVRAISASGKPLYDGKVATIIEKGMSCNEVYYGLYIEGVTVEKRSTPLIGKSEIIGNTSFLAPFFAEDLELVTSRAEEKKPKSQTISIRTKHGTVAIPTKIEYDDSFWLAYRMELAKEVVNGLLFTGKSPETIADETTTIVNGIVERLKGGENGKV